MVRCYYDMDEIRDISPDHLAVEKWNKSTKKWLGIETTIANTKLRFIEVKVEGNIIIRLDERIIKTYLWVPFFSLGILSLALCTGYIIQKNLKYYARTKKKYELR